jgi:hypothetical protein
MMEAVYPSETSLYFNETTRRYILDGCHLTRQNGQIISQLNPIHTRILNILIFTTYLHIILPSISGLSKGLYP